MTEIDSAAPVSAGHDDARPLLELRSRTPGVASMRVESVAGRSVVVVRIDNSRRKGALTPIDGENIAEAARMALDKRLPLLLFMTSSGADANEGVAARPPGASDDFLDHAR